VRILVTGRQGQLAQSLAERAAGHELVFAGRPEFDLADAGAIERTVASVHPELIVSAAAYTAVDKAEDEPELAMQVNGEGPGVLARAAAAVGAPVIHLSTDYVFDGEQDTPWREDDPVAPLGVYGATKLAGERAVINSTASYAIVRTAWVYSPFGHNFVKTMIRLAASRDCLEVVEDQQGCPTSAFDLADAILVLIDRWRVDPSLGTRQVYHFAGPDRLSWAQFAREIFTQSAALDGPVADVRGIATSNYPTKARRPRKSALDSSRFANLFGYRAPGLRKSLMPVVSRLVRSNGFSGAADNRRA
jgi:dTDP-4-dehydrorhamnose reductase